MLDELTFGFPVLSLVLFFPLIGALILWLLEDEDLIKNAALGIGALELVLAGNVLFHFQPGTAAMQFSERVAWIPPLGISYQLAVDGISVLFVGLTALLTVAPGRLVGRAAGMRCELCSDARDGIEGSAG